MAESSVQDVPSEQGRGDSSQPHLHTSDNTASTPRPDPPQQIRRCLPVDFKDIPNKIAEASWIKYLFLAIPVAWTAHWQADEWGHVAVFVLCFVSIIPLQNVFDWCADRITDFEEDEKALDPDSWWRAIADLLAITLKNCVEAALAAILLKNCHLRLLQSTVVGDSSIE
ncbi:hypothetical protein C8Q79DRAFT_292114 [Trametes meyenii]|nr:hypothetical protein C8Q79DRAFT_292114 [Trametes meyenii]